jgi:hypothetical protein
MHGVPSILEKNIKHKNSSTQQKKKIPQAVLAN